MFDCDGGSARSHYATQILVAPLLPEVVQFLDKLARCGTTTTRFGRGRSRPLRASCRGVWNKPFWTDHRADFRVTELAEQAPHVPIDRLRVNYYPERY